MRSVGKSVLACALAFAFVPVIASAQPAPPAPLVIVPYEQPGNNDPHAIAITQALTADLSAAGVEAKVLAPVDHLAAVAGAGKLCTANGATGILIPDGRYEQTRKVIPAPFVTILRYPTHVEFRLDEIACDGTIRWTATTTGDEAPAGAFSVGNLGAAVDAAFRTAVAAAAQARAAAPVVEVPAGALPAPSPPADTAPSTWLLIPYEQTGIADPHGPDITHSLLTQLTDHKLTIKLGTPVDHAAVIDGASQLCATATAQAIIVPDLRVEQSSVTGRSHAELRLTQLDCTGAIVREAAGQADMGQAFIGNFGAAIVGVSERAMIPAIDQLLKPEDAAPAAR
jgi:hypothetical protein